MQFLSCSYVFAKPHSEEGMLFRISNKGRDRAPPKRLLSKLFHDSYSFFWAIVSYRHLKYSGGFNGIGIHDLCDDGGMLFQ